MTIATGSLSRLSINMNLLKLTRALCSLQFLSTLLIHRARGAMAAERSKALESGGRDHRNTHFNDTKSIYSLNVTKRYVPKPLLNSPSSICKLCNDTWSIPRPNYIVRGRTCSYWNNIFDQDQCPMYQSTYGAVCGCTQYPDPPCPVCDGYGDYIWTVSSNNRASYIVDQCIQMILDLSKDSQVCSSYRRFVAKLCCTQPPVSDDYLSIADKLRSDDRYVTFGTDDYSYSGPVYDDKLIRYDDYYLRHGKSKNKKKKPKKDPKKKMKKHKSDWYHDYQDDYLIYTKSKFKSKAKAKSNRYPYDDYVYNY